MTDFSFLEFAGESALEQNISCVLSDYLKYIANKRLRIYKGAEYIHTRGAKVGQSLYSHIMDLISFIDRLTDVIDLNDEEWRCVYLALTVHDINKIACYGKDAQGWEKKYADAATQENIRQELERLAVDEFFPRWRDYLQDIVFLAHAHQAAATGTTIVIDQSYIDQTVLKARLKGPLKYLMQAADSADNSHSGDYLDPTEVHLRDKLLTHINAVMSRTGSEYEYRFIGHRIGELRGLLTNILHNEFVGYLQEKYCQQACVDVQYYPEGVNYLLDTSITLEWNSQILQEVARRVQKRLAKIHLKKLAQFIKAKPDAITVDGAAMETGATVEDIFETIALIVMDKRYPSERKLEREHSVRADLEAVLQQESVDNDLKQKIEQILGEAELVPGDDEALKRGEFVAAYRKFLAKHCAKQLNAIRQEAWQHVYHLFQLPEAHHPVYHLVNTYRRGYFLARDLTTIALDEMKCLILDDLAQLQQQGTEAQSENARKLPAARSVEPEKNVEDTLQVATEYIVDYLQRNLEIWDSQEEHPLMTQNFGDILRQYASSTRMNKHCCHCGSALKASEWMAVQAPPSIGVQSFSNRLEGGTSREPKRNVCEICRSQFILEKLAWRGHDDKRGDKRVTFYLHLFPYAFFTRPLLRAWLLSMENLRDNGHSAFFIQTRNYFQALQRFQSEVRIEGFKAATNGLNLPLLADAISTTPVLPIVVPGDSYGLQFQLALEKAVVLVQWFECKAILTRSPVPLLNLAHEKIGDGPVVLMVEGMPQNMSWLVPQTSMTRSVLVQLVDKLTLLYQLSGKLYYADPKSKDKTDHIPHDFAVAAADDPLAIYYEASRCIEKKVSAEKSKANIAPEVQAMYLSKDITPILDALVKL